MNVFSRTTAASLIASMPVVAQANSDRPKLDPDDAYKSNCLRCHTSTPQYSAGVTQTMVMHMHVRANLTQDEADAVLEYLTGGAPVLSPEASRGELPQKDNGDSLVAALDPTFQPPPATRQPPARQPPPAPPQPRAPATVEAVAPSTGAASDAQPFIGAGLVAFKRLRFRQAEAEFRKAVEADPNSAAAHFYLGYTLYKMAEPTRRLHPRKQESAAQFAKAYELDPDFKPVWQMKR